MREPLISQQTCSPDDFRPQEKTVGNYTLEQTLGKGTFGKVKLARHRQTGEFVAIKILEKSKIAEVSDIERVSRQIHILKIMRHPNIIQLYELIESKKYLFLVMEYCSNGQLFDYIVKKERLASEEACRFYQQLLAGVQYLHELGIVHRDLKPQNMLLDEQYNIKIVDFGLSNTYSAGDKLKTACGSPCYAAPEMVLGKLYEPMAIDLWSSGVILYAMLTGYLPFEDNNNSVLYKKIINLEYRIPAFVESSAKALLLRLIVGPEKRLTLKAVEQTQFFQLVNYTDRKGIRVGECRTPVDPECLQQVQRLYGYESTVVRGCVENNKHNHFTTCYYLHMKKLLRSGRTSRYDINSETFDYEMLEKECRSPKARDRNKSSNGSINRHVAHDNESQGYPLLAEGSNFQGRRANLDQIKKEINSIDRGMFDHATNSLMRKRQNFKITKRLSLRKEALHLSESRQDPESPVSKPQTLSPLRNHRGALLQPVRSKQLQNLSYVDARHAPVSPQRAVFSPQKNQEKKSMGYSTFRNRFRQARS